MTTAPATDYTAALYDQLRRDIFLAELYPYDPGTGSTTTLYYSSDRYGTLSTDSPASQQFTPALIGGLNRATDSIVPGTVALLPSFRGGEIKLGNNFGSLDSLGDYYWDGRRCVIKHTWTSAKYGRLSHSSAKVLFDGEIDRALIGLDEVTLVLKDYSSRFDYPITKRVFRGSSYCLKGGGTSSDFVDYGSDSSLAITGAFSWGAWVWLESTASKQHLDGWTTTPWKVYVDTSGHINLEWLKSAATVTKTSTATLSTKRWYHVTWTLSATTVTLYLLDESTYAETKETFTGTGFTGRDTGASSVRFFRSAGVTTDPSSALLDDRRLWNKTLTGDEVRERRSRPLNSTEAGDANLIHYVKFDDGTGSTVTDSASGGLNGTISGTCTWYPAMEGADEFSGTPKPDAWGVAEGIPAIPVDVSTQIYCLTGTKCNAVSAVYEGGNNLTLDTGYTDRLTFLAASTTAGKYDRLIDTSGTYIRLGSAATLPVTATVQGDASGLGYVYTAADIVRRIVCNRGPSPLTDPTNLDTSSFTALDTDNSAVVGVYTRGTETIQETVQFVLGSIGAVGFFNRADGKFHVERFEGVSGTSQITLSERDIIEIEPIETDPPAWWYSVLFRKNYTVLTQDQIAAAVTNFTTLRFLMNEWRYMTGRRDSVLTSHPRSRQLEVETGLSTWQDAGAEANRLLTLLSTEARGFRIKANLRGVNVDQLYRITITFSDWSKLNVKQSRLGLQDGDDFIALGIADVTEEGATMLEVWG